MIRDGVRGLSPHRLQGSLCRREVGSEVHSAQIGVRAGLTWPPQETPPGLSSLGQGSQPSPLHTPQKRIQDQRQSVMTEFKQAHEFLREREQHLLGRLEALQRELAEGREKYEARAVAELARLALVISELEAKAQQPAAELLQVRRLRGSWTLSPVPTWDPGRVDPGRAAASQAATFSTETSGESPPPAPPPPVVP